jgi:plastocyanin
VSPRLVHPAARAAALAAALAGCAGAAARPARHDIAIRAFAYQPASEPVHAGDTLVFVNHDPVPHTATAADGAWDTGQIPANGTRTVVVGDRGIGAYRCAFHPTMTATLTPAE